MTIEILQSDTLVRTLMGPAEAGVNRIVWGLERKGIQAPDADEDAPEPAGPEVFPGTYVVRVSVNGDTATETVTVRPDPRRHKTMDVLAANLEQWRRGQEALGELRAAVRRMEETQELLSVYEDRLGGWDAADPEARDSLVARTGEVKSQLAELLGRLRMPPAKGIVDDTTVVSRLQTALGEATGTPYAPSTGRVANLDWQLDEARSVLHDIQAFYTGALPAYRDALQEAGFDLLTSGAPGPAAGT